jgi:hypothetical protein
MSSKRASYQQSLPINKEWLYSPLMGIVVRMIVFGRLMNEMVRLCTKSTISGSSFCINPRTLVSTLLHVNYLRTRQIYEG